MIGIRDLLLIGIVVFIWGLNFVVIKIGLEQFPPLLFSALRFLTAALPWAFILGRGNLKWSVILSVGFALGFAQFSFLFVGIYLGMPPGLSSLILQSQVIFTVILGIFVFADLPNRFQWAGILTGILGIAVIGETVAADAVIPAISFVFLLLAGFSWAVSNILMKRAGQIDMLRLILWMSLVPPIPLLLLSAIFETGQIDSLLSFDLKAAGTLFYVGLVSTIFAFAIWGQMLKRHSPLTIAPFSLLVPIFGMSLSALLLGESFGPVRMAGSALVMAGLALIVLSPRLQKAWAARTAVGRVRGSAPKARE